MTTGETITLTRRTFVRKVMSLLFNMLSRLVITFLPSLHIFIHIYTLITLPCQYLLIFCVMKSIKLIMACQLLKSFIFLSYTTAIIFLLTITHTILIAQLVKNLPAMQETPVRFLGGEDPLEKG